ncbi:MAG: hypothetical protein PHQ72_12595 [Hespellia sp.]|nr:hypothetical protein [Hespellia sp.]
MKKRIVIMAVMASILVMTACGCQACAKWSGEPVLNQKEQSDATKKTEETKTETDTSKKDEKETKLSEDIYHFEVSVNGEIYQLPMKYAQYTKSGWSYSGDEEEMVSPSAMLLSDWFKRGDNRTLAYLTNFDVSDVSTADSYLGGLMFDRNYIKDEDTQILLADEIQLGVSTPEEVKEAYGEPTKETESETFPTMTYAKDGDSFVELGFDAANGNVLAEITIQNPVMPKEFEESEAPDEDAAEETEDETYEAPSAVSSDLFEYTMSFAGNLYQLPVPVSEFVKNGWSMVADATNLAVEPGKTGRVTLMKDNQTLWVKARNSGEIDADIGDCLVSNLAANVKDCDVEMEIADGIQMGMSQEDLEKAIADYEYKKEVSSYTYYEITDKDRKNCGYEVIVRDGKVTGIEVTGSGKVK